MSIFLNILPVLTVVSLFFYIFSAERAWLPKAGTTEWITRTITQKQMTLNYKPAFLWRDLPVFLGIVVVYGGFLAVSNLTDVFENIYYISAASIFVGIIYLIANVIFENRATAFFAAVMTAVDITLLQPSVSTISVPIFLAVFAYLTLISSNAPITLLPAGIFLGISVCLEPVSAVFTILPLTVSVTMWIKNTKFKPVLIYLLCCILFPAVIYCAVSYITYGEILIIRLLTSFIPPITVNIQYLAVTAVVFIMLVIHIFKDKSFTALFISLGFILCAVCTFLRLHLIPLFAGLVIAYLADIIIKRGKSSHRVFCIIFGIIMLIPLLISVIYPELSTYSTHITYIS